MVSSHRLKSVDFYRKIPRDLTEASVSGAGLSIVAAFAMIFLFGMELNHYLTMSTTTSVIVDKSSDGEFLRIDFNISFPALSCEFASVDVSDVIGTNRLNITKTVRKYPIDSNLQPTGSEFHSGLISRAIKHDDHAANGEYADGSISLTISNFDRVTQRHPILVVNFYAPWCHWSNRLKPSWERAAKIIKERYDPEMDGRILLGKIDCTEQQDLCRRHHIQGYPSIRIFRKGSDVRDDHGQHDHESYYGDRDTESLVKTMENLVSPISLVHHQNSEHEPGHAADDAKRPAPLVGGCRVEGFIRAKKVPGNLIIAARSAAHSFDASKMNISHIVSHLSFGKSFSEGLLTDMKRVLPHLGGSHNRLDGREYITHRSDSNDNVTIEHYLQIVKTEVIARQSYSEQKLMEEYEYTVHSALAHSVDIPSAKFHFELSPMQVLITKDSKSFCHFITNVCAIVGGVFTVAGILDSILHNTLKMIKKVELGKNY